MPAQKSDRILQCLAAVRKEFRMLRELFITNTSIVRAGPFARGLPDGREETGNKLRGARVTGTYPWRGANMNKHGAPITRLSAPVSARRLLPKFD
jgi:hypothetical protein